MQPRLKDIIVQEINPSLKEMFGYKNLYMGPKIEKVVLNMGLGLDGNDAKIINSCHLSGRSHPNLLSNLQIQLSFGQCVDSH